MQLGFLPENAGFGSMVTESLLWYGWWKKSCISWYDKKSHYLQGFKHPRWCRMSSINSIDHGMSSFMLFTPASWFNAGSTLVTAENQGSTCSQPSFCLWFFSGDLANQSICQMICFAFILDTEITKKWGRKLCLKPTKAPFSIRRRSKISRNSWPLAVRCCSFRGARCCGFFHRTTGGPWCSKFLRPALTLCHEEIANVVQAEILAVDERKWETTFWKSERGRTSQELKVKSQNLSMHRPPPLFLSNFPPGELPEPFGQFQSLLDQLRKRAGTSPSKVLMDVNRHVATYFVETFPSEGRLHSHMGPQQRNQNCRNGWYAPTGATSMKPGDSQILNHQFFEKLQATHATHQLRPGSCCSMKLWWKFRWSPKNKKVWKKTYKNHTKTLVVPVVLLWCWCFCFCFGEIKVTTCSCTVAIWNSEVCGISCGHIQD